MIGALDGSRVDEHGIERSLALGHRLLGAVRAVAAGLGLDGFELPPVVGSTSDQAALRSAAPLYLASELEAARLVPALETLAGVYATGAISFDLGTATPILLQVWHNRNSRFGRTEREAFFAHLFGTGAGPVLAGSDGRNTEFEPLLIDLTEALYKLQPSPLIGPLLPSQASLQATGSELAANLAPRGGGMVAFAAHDILRTIAQAVAVFSVRAVQAALGASSPWRAVANAAQRYMNEQVEVEPHVERGKAGQLVLAWLAGVAPHLGDVGVTLAAPGDAVVGAAGAWLQASLTLREQEAAAVR